MQSPLLDNIWVADLADMQLISHINKGLRFCYGYFIIDIYSKYAWVISLKDKEGITITNAFPKILNGSNRKPNKIFISYRTVSSKIWSIFSKFLIFC